MARNSPISGELKVISLSRLTMSWLEVGVVWRAKGLIWISSTSSVCVFENSGKIDGLPR